MRVALDANILIRTVDRSAPLRPAAMTAVTTLKSQGHSLILVPQALYEFWVVATRPLANNGLGFSASQCLQEIATLKSYYSLLLDTPTLFTKWVLLVSTHACLGKVAHDARYVAAMNTHGITTLLTFNGGDFQRFAGITVIDPANLSTP